MFCDVVCWYRAWALADPHRFRLVFTTPHGSGRVDPGRTIPPAHRGMITFLEAIAAVGPPADTVPPARNALERQLERWAANRPGGPELPAAVLQLGVLAWTRLHGLVSLELEGAFAAMELDPAQLFAAEVDHLIAQGVRPL